MNKERGEANTALCRKISLKTADVWPQMRSMEPL